ncbi:MAG: dihydrolipoyl dehydrogenase, partial [Chloroflexi bacterium]
MTDNYTLAVLGGGPAGYVAALRAAQLGAQVVLIEKERVGGTCLNVGCIPTKALTTSTELLLKARRAHEFGLFVTNVAPDLPALMNYKQETVDGLVGGVEHLLKEAGVTLLHGEGRLTAPTTLQVRLNSGDTITVSAHQVILAPGSVTARPPIPGLDLLGVITSTEALDISDIPARLVVIGGGVIGLEFACIYEALGSQVSILEMMPTLLPGG